VKIDSIGANVAMVAAQIPAVRSQVAIVGAQIAALGYCRPPVVIAHVLAERDAIATDVSPIAANLAGPVAASAETRVPKSVILARTFIILPRAGASARLEAST
jgi:hypothetical protein